jgi:hypothetical protein
VIQQLIYDFWLWLQYLFGVSPHEIGRRYERRGAARRGAPSA